EVEEEEENGDATTDNDNDDDCHDNVDDDDGEEEEAEKDDNDADDGASSPKRRRRNMMESSTISVNNINNNHHDNRNNNNNKNHNDDRYNNNNINNNNNDNGDDNDDDRDDDDDNNDNSKKNIKMKFTLKPDIDITDVTATPASDDLMKGDIKTEAALLSSSLDPHRILRKEQKLLQQHEQQQQQQLQQLQKLMMSSEPISMFPKLPTKSKSKDLIAGSNGRHGMKGVSVVGSGATSRTSGLGSSSGGGGGTSARGVGRGGINVNSAGGRGGCGRGRGITLNMLMKDGVIESGGGCLSLEYLGKKFAADLLPNGKIRWQENNEIFNSPSAWASHCKKLVNPSKKSGCGWASIKYKGRKLVSWKSLWCRKQRHNGGTSDNLVPLLEDSSNILKSSRKSKDFYPQVPEFELMEHQGSLKPPLPAHIGHKPLLNGKAKKLMDWNQSDFQEEALNLSLKGSKGESRHSPTHRPRKIHLTPPTPPPLLLPPSPSLLPPPPPLLSQSLQHHQQQLHQPKVQLSPSSTPPPLSSLPLQQQHHKQSPHHSHHHHHNHHHHQSKVQVSPPPASSSSLPPPSLSLTPPTTPLPLPPLPQLPRHTPPPPLSLESLQQQQQRLQQSSPTIPTATTRTSASPKHHHHNNNNHYHHHHTPKLDKLGMLPPTTTNSASSPSPTSRYSLVKHSTLGDRNTEQDPNTLVECETFEAYGKFQPFSVSVTTNSMFLIDFHCHLTSSEVLGYLAGKWDQNTQHLNVLQAFPCLSRLGDKENAPLIEAEIRHRMAKSGLSLVGWYHSHPHRSATPTVRDIECQMAYQLKMKGIGSVYHPCLGFIVAPYNKSSKKKESMFQAFWVMPPLVEQPMDYGIPMEIQYSVYQNPSLTEELLSEMKSLVDFYKGSPDVVRFSSIWHQSVTYLDKVKWSLLTKLPQDQDENSSTLEFVRSLLLGLRV
ncbi:hypothetical protein Ahia01_001195900, partial [Argonauta hians]